MQIVKVGNYEVGQGRPLMLMAGPCVLEGYDDWSAYKSNLRQAGHSLCI